jgi:hypothetical protein
MFSKQGIGDIGAGDIGAGDIAIGGGRGAVTGTAAAGGVAVIAIAGAGVTAISPHTAIGPTGPIAVGGTHEFEIWGHTVVAEGMPSRRAIGRGNVETKFSS